MVQGRGERGERGEREYLETTSGPTLNSLECPKKA